MSVLINMEMPTSCIECPFLDYEQGFCLASSVKNESGWYEAVLCPSGIKGERHDDCPLVPVPLHGRLIEDTAVQEQIDEWLDSVGDVVVGHGLSYYGELLGCIKDAPTIIPASGGKENE